MIEIEASCGNVYEDLQVNEVAAMQVKAGLASKIADITAIPGLLIYKDFFRIIK